MSEHRVLIVGGGAAGVLLAVALLEAAAAAGADPVAVTLVERRAEVGPGLAYSTTSSQHLLNNTAGCMSGVSGDPDHFVRWLRARGHDAGGDDYVPRRWYGDYLTDLLAAAHVPDGSGLEVVHGEAIDLVEHAAGVTLALGDGRTLRADRAVLAVGNPPPHRRTTDLADVVVNDPWAPDALDGIGPASRVLLVGTGLTMVDVALTLARGESAPAMTAASRHGLLPRRHRQVPVRPRPVGLPAAVTLPDLLARVRGRWPAPRGTAPTGARSSTGCVPGSRASGRPWARTTGGGSCATSPAGGRWSGTGWRPASPTASTRSGPRARSPSPPPASSPRPGSAPRSPTS